ncbi:hypothetical protein EDD22DRAFT_149381 [Suillus occidentalis]|nr:hypothetical protein EDD22DRAFT_149381 [Suillus occidentalis]
MFALPQMACVESSHIQLVQPVFKACRLPGQVASQQVGYQSSGSDITHYPSIFSLEHLRILVQLQGVYRHRYARIRAAVLPAMLLCPKGTYLRSMGVDRAVGYVIDSLQIDASDEGIHLRQNILELCPVGQLEQLRPRALDQSSCALRSRFTQRGNIDDLDEGV